MKHNHIPILIGVGQVTEKQPDLAKASSPLDLMEQATRKAVADAGLQEKDLQLLDLLIVVKSFRESTRNSPQALSNRLGATSAQQWLTPDGGNTPQYLVNRYSEAIAQGKLNFALFTGSEAIDTARRFSKAGLKTNWAEPADREPKMLYTQSEMANPQEKEHGIYAPASVYPLFENALRKHYGETIAQHQKVMGELFSPLTVAATKSPYSWYPIQRSAKEISQPTATNRFVGWPYTKYMNAMNQINQSAALILCSTGFARQMGVAESRWLYLHGCADTTDTWNVSERLNFHSSPAISTMRREVLDMAQMSIADIDFFDFYSCFPSVVQIARDAFGIAKNSSKPLSITGGLPFHGGAGNNYVMNSIAAMAELLRANPSKFGLVTANGGYVTKHAAGIYSTQVPKPTNKSVPWQRRSPKLYQQEIDSLEYPTIIKYPQGKAVVETYTVLFQRDNKPYRGIVIGRLGASRASGVPRFIANTPTDIDLLEAMTKEDFIGHLGKVQLDLDSNLNIFCPD